MPFNLLELTSDSDFEELVQVEWDSYETPYCNLIRLFFPIFGEGAEGRTEAMKEGIQRQTAWHKGDPTSHWVTVTDTDSGKMVGAACWHVYESNPYATESDEECDWYAKGEDRDMANMLMGQFLTPRMTYMTKPHIFLDICFVHPDYRRRGAGRLLMDWGVNKADELGYETYIDATVEGKPLYDVYGFISADKHDFDVSEANPSQRWKEQIAEPQKLLPFSFWPMWRPAKEEKSAGKTTPPWVKAT